MDLSNNTTVRLVDIRKWCLELALEATKTIARGSNLVETAQKYEDHILREPAS